MGRPLSNGRPKASRRSGYGSRGAIMKRRQRIGLLMFIISVNGSIANQNNLTFWVGVLGVIISAWYFIHEET